MQEEIDYKSFVETESTQDCDTSIDSDVEDDLVGFAKLEECNVLDPSSEIEVTDSKVIVINALVHGTEEAVVRFEKDSDLYNYALFFTESDMLSDLAGQYIPVDKVEDGVYEPSESLYNIARSSWVDFSYQNFNTLERISILDKVRTNINYGYITYNTDTGRWESDSYLMLKFTYLTHVDILSFILFSPIFLFPVPILSALYFQDITEFIFDYIPTLEGIGQLVYLSMGLVLVTVILAQTIFVLFLRKVVLDKFKTKIRTCPL